MGDLQKEKREEKQERILEETLIENDWGYVSRYASNYVEDVSRYDNLVIN